MATLLYHQHGVEPLELHVVAEHKDGTVDLARDPKGPAIIEGCPLADQPRPGLATSAAASAAKSKRAKAKRSDKPEDEAAPEEPEEPPPGDSAVEADSSGEAPPPDN